MTGKSKLYYFNGRGQMESIHWLLVAAGVEFEEEFLETREYEKLLQDGALIFQQVPMVEIDGMKMVQTRAILSYIARKHNLYGRREQCTVDMYVERTRDLMDVIRVHHKLPPKEKEKNLALNNERATTRYFPVYEKVCGSEGTIYSQHKMLKGKLVNL
ncbi:glutathione S-transferase-like [Caretta caretta]|uniref:glutathione S-transferase-like n=1 Tax=Caretta caretta TaxID=8467 RepID=UPI002094130D|nr:glutathione S-transferase-like [Caretta caretta]